MDRCQSTTGDPCHDKTKQVTSCTSANSNPNPGSRKRTDKHHSFKADVDDPTAL
jgi:hypothetical protein